jgi:hypothetical protein
MEDEKVIRWVLKELMGYRNNLVYLDELQQILLTLLPQISDTTFGREILRELAKLENALEEIKYTVDNHLVFDPTVMVVNQMESKFKEFFKRAQQKD